MKLEKMKAKIFLEIVLPVKTMLELKPNLEQKGISSILSDFPRDFQTIWKTRFLQTNYKDVLICMKVQDNLFLNCHANTIRIRDLGRIKVGYDFHNHLES